MRGHGGAVDNVRDSIVDLSKKRHVSFAAVLRALSFGIALLIKYCSLLPWDNVVSELVMLYLRAASSRAS